MNYMILHAENIPQLETVVSQCLAKGWELHAGPAVAYWLGEDGRTSSGFYQAVIQKCEPDPRDTPGQMHLDNLAKVESACEWEKRNPGIVRGDGVSLIISRRP